ncbi:MAG: YlbF family regulator [Acidaminococcaceae bacterium]|nr:YlbF family regulator [Acidaminococcaceae bacterium]MBQ9635218.1 YlbF family regulator [Acidaminococcaceae bacterium]MBQ9697050.1 YlbF family regulator [Acidaminococcaceae bacterium]MBR1590663.1 YlbF family regulator [Acidaminococcaceae bacterium]
MTVYDCANELAREMRATREFAVLKEAKERLAVEPDTKALVNKFMQLGQEVEIARYQKKEIPAGKEAEFNDMMRTLSLNPLAMNYLNAFQRFQLMFQDVSKTITDVVKEVAE